MCLKLEKLEDFFALMCRKYLPGSCIVIHDDSKGVVSDVVSFVTTNPGQVYPVFTLIESDSEIGFPVSRGGETWFVLEAFRQWCDGNGERDDFLFRCRIEGEASWIPSADMIDRFLPEAWEARR